LLKNSNFFGIDFYNILNNFVKKYKCYTLIDLRIGIKVVIENFIRLKVEGKFEKIYNKKLIYLYGSTTYLTIFIGTVRYNLDPLSQHSDQEI